MNNLHPLFAGILSRFKPREWAPLPDFGSTKACLSCGSDHLNHQFDDGWFLGDHIRAPFVWVICTNCNWRRGEKLLADSKGDA